MRPPDPARAGRSDLAWLAAQAGALAVFYWAPGPGALIGATGFAALCARRPDLGLLFAVLTAPFYRFPREIAGVPSFGSGTADPAIPVSEAVIWLAGAGWLIRQIVLRAAPGGFGQRAWRDPLGPYWPAIVFWAVATLSLTASEFLHVSLREYRQVVLDPLLYYALLTAVFRTRRDVRLLFRAFLGVGALVAAISIGHYFFVGVTEATGGVERALAIYQSPNALGLFLGRIAPAAVVVAAFGRGLGRDRAAATAAALLILAAVFLTYSRGAWLGVAVALLFAAAWRGHRRLALAGGAAIVAAAALARLAGNNRLTSDESSSQRLYLWEAALAMIRDHPLQGVGLDNFLPLYPRYMRPEAWREPNISHPHNLVLDYWLRLGLAGPLSLIWLQLSFWRAGRRAYVRLSGGPDQAIVLAMLASMVDFLVHGLFDNSYFLIDLALVFWVSFFLVHRLCGLSATPD